MEKGFIFNGWYEVDRVSILPGFEERAWAEERYKDARGPVAQDLKIVLIFLRQSSDDGVTQQIWTLVCRDIEGKRVSRRIGIDWQGNEPLSVSQVGKLVTEQNHSRLL